MRWCEKEYRVGRRRAFRRRGEHGDRLGGSGSRAPAALRLGRWAATSRGSDRRRAWDWLLERCRSRTSPCAGSWPSWPSAAWRSTTGRSGSSSTPRSSVQKKTLIASEQDRPDVARRRAQWAAHQDRIDPAAWSSSTRPGPRPIWRRLRGWAPRGERLTAKVPHGHWKTMTFLAALRCDRIDAPCLFDGPINGESFHAYVEQFLVPTLGRRRRHHGQSRLPQGQAVRAAIGRPAPSSSSCRYSPDLNPIEQVFAKAQALRSAGPPARPSRCRLRRPRPYPRDRHPTRMLKLLHSRRVRTNVNSSRSRAR